MLCCLSSLIYATLKEDTMIPELLVPGNAGSQGADNTVFLPTKCMQLLETLCAARPNHCILAADFDQLPGTTIPGKNAPLVATTVCFGAPLQRLQLPAPRQGCIEYCSYLHVMLDISFFLLHKVA